MYASINDNIITEEDSYIHIKDRGFLLGDGLFETCKVQNGQIEFFDDHYERLAHSANALMIPFEYEKLVLKKRCVDLIKINGLENKSASIRITLTRGIGLRGINLPEKPKPTLLITTAPYHAPTVEHPIRAMITSITRNPSSSITKFKTLNYLEPILARQEAQKYGFDEGIMLSIDGYVTECSVSNIFIVKNSGIITPSIDSGILPGIMRSHVISICHKNGYSILEKLVSVDELMDADEVFQTNSLINIQPISQINKKNYTTTHTVKKIIELYKNSI